jgi:hypothetical protein
VSVKLKVLLPGQNLFYPGTSERLSERLEPDVSSIVMEISPDGEKKLEALQGVPEYRSKTGMSFRLT